MKRAISFLLGSGFSIPYGLNGVNEINKAFAQIKEEEFLITPIGPHSFSTGFLKAQANALAVILVRIPAPLISKGRFASTTSIKAAMKRHLIRKKLPLDRRHHHRLHSAVFLPDLIIAFPVLREVPHF